MEEYNFMTKEDSANTIQMLNLVDVIKNAYQECLDYAETYSVLKEKRKVLFETDVAATMDFKKKLRIAKKTWLEARAKLDPIITEWNYEMETYISRYKYVKLSQYLPDLDYLENWESRPSKEIATATLIAASSLKIPRLFELNPQVDCIKLTNYYPIDWLKKEFKNVYDGLDNEESTLYDV